MTRGRAARLAAALVLALVGASAPAATAGAQVPAVPTTLPAGEAAPAAPAADPAEAIRAEREALEAQREELLGRASEGAAPEGAADELELIAAAERALDAQLEALTRRKGLEAARAALAERIAGGPAAALADPPPYPFALLDAVSDARAAQVERAKAVHAALEAARDALERADTALQKREEERRQARDAAAAGDPARSARLRAEQRVAELRSRVARAARELAVLERDNLRLDASLQDDARTLLDATVDWVRSNVDLAGDPLRAPLREIEEREFEVARSLERVERELQAAESQLTLAERRLAAQPSPPPELSAEVEARRLESQLLGRRAVSLGDRAKQLETNRTTWERRRAVLAGSASREELDAWQLEVAERLKEEGRTARLAEARLLEVRQEAAALEERAAQAASQGRPSAPWDARRARLLREMAALYEQELGELAADRRLAQRLLEDIASRATGASFAERLDEVRDELAEIWDTELLAVDDQGITVGKVTGALLVFFLGLLAAVVGTRLLGRLLRRRLDEGAASAIQGLLFYVLVAMVFLLALRTVNIPLTAFAILGGALAIGVGFGSQNIVNNFISGLILLAERPIKVGDLVEVGQVRGYVERIGARSTRVRTPENTHLIIPNSHFLEKEVINWTLSDDDIRTSLDVGVIYGSPTREVDRLLRRAMTEHGKILKNPEPEVWFKGFGDNSLDFQALFWVRSRQLGERRRIESDVRFRIDNLFREAGIVIAFPQRDVHLDSVRPIEVRMVPPHEDDETGSGG